MIVDKFKIFNYKVTIFFDTTCDDIDVIIEALKDIHCPNKYITQAIDNLSSCNLNIGLTYSNLRLKSSVIVISKTSSIAQMVNTTAHEYYHLICHIKKTLKIEDEEELANLNGTLNMRSYKIIEKL